MHLEASNISNKVAPTRRRHRYFTGFSLTEIIVCVAIVGIIASIALPSYVGTATGARQGVAKEALERLNIALTHFNQANYEIIVTASASSTAEELLIVRTLQYRDATIPAVGSPYLRQDWNPTASSSTSDYRLIWMGKVFKLLAPGTSGTGLKVTQSGEDMGVKYVHPANFTLAGK